MIRLSLLLGLCTVFVSPLFSQNLVKNPSFENIGHCLSKGETDAVGMNIPSLLMAMPEGWTAPSKSGTPDLYHACYDSTNGKKEMFRKTTSIYGAPRNSHGWQAPHSGENYAGIYLVSSLFKNYNYREYLSGELLEPLKKGKTYTVTFWCNLADNSELASDALGVYLSKNAVTYPDSFHRVIEVEPQVANPEKRYLTSMDHWMKVSATYEAKGGERHLLIGSFNPYDTADYQLLYKPSRFLLQLIYASYYFIDDVCVSEQGADCYANVQDTVDVAEGLEQVSFNPAVTRVKGKAYAYKMFEKEGIAEAKVRFWSKGRELGKMEADEKGLFSFQLDTAYNSFVFVEHSDYFPKAVHISNKPIHQLEALMTPIKKKRSVMLTHYMITGNGTQYIPYSIEELGLWAEFLRKHPLMKIKISSYGLSAAYKKRHPELTKEENKARYDSLALEQSKLLSREITERLMSLGVPEEQLSYEGLGNQGSYPVFKNQIQWVEDLEKPAVASAKPLARKIWDAEVLKENDKLVLENIYFHPNSAELTPSSHPHLQELSTFLMNHPTFEIAVHGHTDNGYGRTDPAYLLQLSEERAAAVKAFLVLQGVEEVRVKVKGFGMARPIASNDTDEGKQKNRRTEFVVLKK